MKIVEPEDSADELADVVLARVLGITPQAAVAPPIAASFR